MIEGRALRDGISNSGLPRACHDGGRRPGGGATRDRVRAGGARGVERAWRNYNAIVGGTRQLWQLSPIELQEVMLLDRDVRGLEPDRRSPREKCLDSELDRLGAPPTELALRSIDLKCSQR